MMHLLHEVKVLKILRGRYHECAEDRGTGQFTLQILKKDRVFGGRSLNFILAPRSFGM
mgnify:CR=1 FL=1